GVGVSVAGGSPVPVAGPWAVGHVAPPFSGGPSQWVFGSVRVGEVGSGPRLRAGSSAAAAVVSTARAVRGSVMAVSRTVSGCAPHSGGAGGGRIGAVPAVSARGGARRPATLWGRAPGGEGAAAPERTPSGAGRVRRRAGGPLPDRRSGSAPGPEPAPPSWRRGRSPGRPGGDRRCSPAVLLGRAGAAGHDPGEEVEGLPAGESGSPQFGVELVQAHAVAAELADVVHYVSSGSGSSSRSGSPLGSMRSTSAARQVMALVRCSHPASMPAF